MEIILQYIINMYTLNLHNVIYQIYFNLKKEIVEKICLGSKDSGWNLKDRESARWRWGKSIRQRKQHEQRTQKGKNLAHSNNLVHTGVIREPKEKQLRDEAGNVGQGPEYADLTGHRKKCGLYLGCSGKPLKVYKETFKLLIHIFKRSFLAALYRINHAGRWGGRKRN